MESNRRKFLQMAGIAPAAAVTGTLAASPPPVSGAVALTREAFARCKGQDFRFSVDPLEPVDAKLVEVEPLPNPRTRTDDARSFRLVFEAAPGKALDQASYRVDHPQFGNFVLFISPNDAEGHVAEAIFNLV
jgi:hypothetical protein